MLEVRNLTKQFGNVLAVNEISFEVKRGEVFGMLGTNGAGKTTTMKILACLLKPTSGLALIDGLDVTQNQMEVKRRIGYLPEMPNLFEKLTGREFMAMLGTLRGLEPEVLEERVAKYIRILEFGDFLNLEIGTYSKGMRQRVAFASSVLHEPPILILDEPTSGLDPRYSKMVKSWIRDYAEKGNTILMSTHVTEIADSLCDRVAIIHDGRIVGMDTPTKLKKELGAGTLEDVFVMLVEGK
ncbi:MAG: ABC transporter ATP-binding protein [Candidatus Thermoplasmatota archaeon]|nr:ABC transporter ATP-binding protein [Candidatus Thermoplasmatota archaeon]MBU4144022.1 ABC transporter ATP-binding protein [Candidatus Thermoplasmatota archaeon]MBU4591864.1 ABC transporter ATP-binding protein [Candidatus Thermoplasmatota archaeon]